MTKKTDAVREIQKKFASDFTLCQIAYDNEPVAERVNSFVRISVNMGPGNPNLDSSFERTTGIVFLQAIVPKGRGDLEAWSLAETAAEVLTYKTFSGVRLTSADYTNVGLLGDALQQDSGWYQINVAIPFWIEHYN